MSLPYAAEDNLSFRSLPPKRWTITQKEFSGTTTYVSKEREGDRLTICGDHGSVLAAVVP